MLEQYMVPGGQFFDFSSNFRFFGKCPKWPQVVSKVSKMHQKVIFGGVGAVYVLHSVSGTVSQATVLEPCMVAGGESFYFCLVFSYDLLIF